MRNKSKQSFNAPGFTLIEIVAGIAIFGLLVVAVMGAYGALVKSTKAARMKTITASLAARELEVVRNMSYVSIGTQAGNPSGSLPDQDNPRAETLDGVSFSVYYEVTYMDDPADGTILAGTDTSPADYKQVKLFVDNNLAGELSTFVTSVSPKGLEGLDDAGAILILVFDAAGVPVPGAAVTIENDLLNPTISLNRTSDSEGKVLEVGLPASVNGYHIEASKTGYTTDETYPLTVDNPNPINPDATVVEGVVTQVSMQIDLLSILNLRTLNSLCQPISGVGVNVRGEKLVGLLPDVYKFDHDYVSSAGLVALADIEWDTYIPTLLPSEPYTLLGTSPVQEIAVQPGTTHTFTMILGDEGTGYSLLVLVKDSGSGAAIEGATVHLQKGGSQPQDYYGTTGGSVWRQADWTAGAGQEDWVFSDRYFDDDGNVDINSVPTGLRLKKITGRYVSPGSLESSTFDTGTSDTDFTSLEWEPVSQDPSASLSFQIATNNDNSTWEYLGPDGTSDTYYTVSGTTINPIHDNSRYVRYKAFLSTTDDKKTPILTSLIINYVSGCYTPGQVAFTDLTQGQNYDIDVSATGYQTHLEEGLNISGNKLLEVFLSP